MSIYSLGGGGDADLLKAAKWRGKLYIAVALPVGFVTVSINNSLRREIQSAFLLITGMRPIHVPFTRDQLIIAVCIIL